MSTMVKIIRQKRRKGAAQMRNRKRRVTNKGSGARNGVTQAVPVAYAPPSVRNRTALQRSFQATEFLISPSLSSTQISGADLYELELNPAAWNTTRACAEAQLWGYYRFKKCVFHFESTAPTAFGGQIAVGCDTSVGEKAGYTGPSRLAYIMALPGSRTAPVWQSFNIPFDCRRGYTPYNWFQSTVSDGGGAGDPMNTQGRLLIACSAPITNVTVATTITWTVRVEYIIEFGRPELVTPVLNTTILLPAGTSLNWNANGQVSQASFAGFAGMNPGQVFLVQPPIVEWFDLESPVPNYFVLTLTGGVVTAWSNYPTDAVNAGDCRGTGVGTSSQKAATMYAAGFV